MNAFEMPGADKITLIAAADHSAKRYYGVVVDSNGKAALAGAGKRIAGVIRTGEIAGGTDEIVTSGISFVVYGAAVTAGKEVAMGTGGKFIEAVAGQPVVGIAIVGGAADGDIGCILLKDGNLILPEATAIADAAAAAGANPTKAEYDDLVTKFNAVLAALKAANVVA